MIMIPYKSFNDENKTILEFDEYQHSFVYYRVNDRTLLRHLYRSYSDLYNKSRDLAIRQRSKNPQSLSQLQLEGKCKLHVKINVNYYRIEITYCLKSEQECIINSFLQ